MFSTPRSRLSTWEAERRRFLAASDHAIGRRAERNGIPSLKVVALARDDVRIHDLRHTVASEAVKGGERLPIVEKFPDHTQTQTTARYAHLADGPLQGVSERIATLLKQAMGR